MTFAAGRARAAPAVCRLGHSVGRAAPGWPRSAELQGSRLGVGTGAAAERECRKCGGAGCAAVSCAYAGVCA